MTNFEWYYKEIMTYCIMKLGVTNKYTIDLLTKLENFDEDLKKIYNVLGRTSVGFILSKDKERIDKQTEYLSLEYKKN